MKPIGKKILHRGSFQASGLLVWGHNWIAKMASHVSSKPQFGQVCPTAKAMTGGYISRFCFSIKTLNQKYADVWPIPTTGISNHDETSHRGGNVPSRKADDARLFTSKVSYHPEAAYS